MENLLDSLFAMPTNVANDWAAVAQSEGSQDPCCYVKTADLKVLFTKECEDKGFGTCYFAPGLNVFLRGDVKALEGEKTLVRAYRSESSNRLVFVKIELPTAKVVGSLDELVKSVVTKKKVEADAPSL